MRLVEVDAKRIVHEAGIRIPDSFFLERGTSTWPNDQAWDGPVMIKAQVREGRRGKRGLIKTANSIEEVVRILEELGAVECAGFLVEKRVEIVEEWLVSAMIDRSVNDIRVHISSKGGAEAYETESFAVDAIPTDRFPVEVVEVAKRLGSRLVENDALSIEINPFAKLSTGEWMALDAKIELDDAALGRHADRQIRFPEVVDSIVDLDGDIGLLLSGGGASLIALDALSRVGGRAANYAEASGNPSPEFMTDLAKRILSKPGLRGLWMAGSHANFTDIEATVKAVLETASVVGWNKPIVIRRDGPNVEAAKAFADEWSRKYGVVLRFHDSNVSLDASAQELVSLL
jgi:succinyl-CoA synthetase beta subunit